MSDYIEREKAIAVIYGQHVGGKDACENARPNTYGADLREIVVDIEDIPAADVRPVVLCRDCVNYGEMLSGYDHRLICHKFALTTKPNFYCACGERRNFGTDMREES